MQKLFLQDFMSITEQLFEGIDICFVKSGVRQILQRLDLSQNNSLVSNERRPQNKIHR